VRFGRGFTLEELKEAGIGRLYAKTVGISVDHRRTNKSVEAMKANVERLKTYKARLVVFHKKQDVTADFIGSTTASKDFFVLPKTSDAAYSTTKVTDVSIFYCIIITT
jgi:hypothetical protein